LRINTEDKIILRLAVATCAGHLVLRAAGLAKRHFLSLLEHFKNPVSNFIISAWTRMFLPTTAIKYVTDNGLLTWSGEAGH